MTGLLLLDRLNRRITSEAPGGLANSTSSTSRTSARCLTRVTVQIQTATTPGPKGPTSVPRHPYRNLAVLMIRLAAEVEG